MKIDILQNEIKNVAARSTVTPLDQLPTLEPETGYYEANGTFFVSEEEALEALYDNEEDYELE